MSGGGSRVSRLVALAALVALLVVPAASAAPGQLDPTFGSGGTVRLFPNDEELATHAVAVQTDSKIVLAGFEAPGSVLVMRLLANGELDPSFGQGGKALTPFPGGFGEARAVTIQPDGKIVIAGQAKGPVNSDFLVARYNGDGSPDASFGDGDGVELIPIGEPVADLEDQAEAVAIGPSGRILVTGEAELAGSGRGAGVAVLEADGDPDSSFAADGIAILKTTGVEEADEGQAIAELPNGRILVGIATGDAGSGFTLMQMLPIGFPDPTFGEGDGIVNTPIPGSGPAGADGRLTDFALRPDGRIVASGYGVDDSSSPLNKVAAVEYLANGEPNTAFGSAGTGIFTHRVGSKGSEARAVELAPNGKLLLAGPYDNNDSLAALRLDPLGALDSAFGSGGESLRGLTAPFGETFQDAALDAEERLVLLGRAYVGNNITETSVTRILGDRDPLPAPVKVEVEPPAPANRAPHARIDKVLKKLKAEKLKRFSGTAGDPDGDPVRVQIAVTRRLPLVKGGAGVKSPTITKCFRLNSKGGLPGIKAKGRICPLRWLPVKGAAKWSFRLKRELPPGRYVVLARAVDPKGSADTEFSRALGNRYPFRVLPSD